MSKSKIAAYRASFFVFSLLLCLIILSCEPEHPPFDEYQIVGFTPIDSVAVGKIFSYGNTLYSLYNTNYSYLWANLRTYDLSIPHIPILVAAGEIDNLDPNSYITHADTFLFFWRYSSAYPQHLCIFNLNRLQPVNIETDFIIYSLTCKGNHVFISSDEGLKIWDISSLPHYTEVFGDTFGRWHGRLTIRDTIMFETYSNTFAFWNVKNPAQPQLIAQGDFFLYPSFVEMTQGFVFVFSSGLLYRFQYDFSDSLILDDIYVVDYYFRDYAVSDTIVYFLGYEEIAVIKADDFSAEQTIQNYRSDITFLSLELREDMIYVLTRNKGIIIYERREP